MIIEFTKTRDTAHKPQRANPSDAGLDVFYSATEPQELIAVHPNTSMLVPTGLRFGVPHGYMLEVKNRSSVAAKLNLVVGVHFQPQENIEGTLYDYPKTISNRGAGALGSTGG